MASRMLLAVMFLYSFFLKLGFSQTLSVEEIIQKHIHARGGLDKIKSIKNICAHGKMYRFGLVYDLEFIQTQENAMLHYAGENEHLLRIPGKFDVKIVSSGSETWQLVDRFDGKGSVPDPMIYPWVEIVVACENDFAGPLIDANKEGRSVTLSAIEDVNGQPAYKFTIQFKNEKQEDWFIDKANFLLTKRLIPYKHPMTGQPTKVEIYYYDYEKQDGLMLAHAVLVDSGPSTIERVFDDFRLIQK